MTPQQQKEQFFRASQYMPTFNRGVDFVAEFIGQNRKALGEARWKAFRPLRALYLTKAYWEPFKNWLIEKMGPARAYECIAHNGVEFDGVTIIEYGTELAEKHIDWTLKQEAREKEVLMFKIGNGVGWGAYYLDHPEMNPLTKN